MQWQELTKVKKIEKKLVKCIFSKTIYWRFTRDFMPAHFAQVRSTHKFDSSNLPHILKFHTYYLFFWRKNFIPITSHTHNTINVSIIQTFNLIIEQKDTKSP